MRFVITGILTLVIIITGATIKSKQEEKTRQTAVTEEIHLYIPAEKTSVCNHFIYGPKQPVLFFKSCTDTQMPAAYK